MATPSIVKHCAQFAELASPPHLEVGSKIQPSYQQLSPRDMLPQDRRSEEWIGVDIETGEGVDMVLDLTIPGSVEKLGVGRFNTVHCHCVLAHVPSIFAMAQAIEELLKPGGWLFLSVPFAWKMHRIPLDLWRFTPQGVDYLFPKIRFEQKLATVSTRRAGEFHSTEGFPELNLGSALQQVGWWTSTSIRVLRKLGLDRGYFDHRALLVESILIMVGQRVEKPTYTYFPDRFVPDVR